jgi:hypothetical protein
MTNPKRALVLGFATLIVAGCQTIREELPTTASPSNGGGTSNLPAIPVVVVPVPVPVPTTGPPSVPTNPIPSTPNPVPTPRPNPGGPVNPGNTSSTVKIGAKVYFIERNGQTLPEGSSIQVGDRIHFDATAKDAQNLPTTTQGAPHWTFTNQGIINVTSSPNDWTPVAIARHGGSFQAWVEADGVRSNTVNVTIH